MNKLSGNKLPLKTLTLLLAATGLGLTACGQKGPLFLPGNPSEIRPQPPEAEQEPGAEEEEESESGSGV